MLRFLAPLFLILIAFPAQASVTVRVDIGAQTMSVDASTGEAYRWRISTGRVGYRTPNGVYRPQRLEPFWRSRRYGNAPMPHSIFFRGGYAIHGTTDIGRLGRPASHGCIRLHPAHAAALYALVQRHSMAGTRIVITGSRPDTEERVAARAPRPAWIAARVPRRVVAPPAYYGWYGANPYGSAIDYGPYYYIYR